MKDYKSVEIMIKPKQVLRLVKLNKIFWIEYKGSVSSVKVSIDGLNVNDVSYLLNKGNITKVNFYNSFGDPMTLKVNYETLESEKV
jgi:hypothetical protein